MQDEVANTILRELREFRIEEEKRWNINNKEISNLLKETKEENKIHDLDFSNDSEKEQLIYNLILKVWNLTERVKALEK